MLRLYLCVTFGPGLAWICCSSSHIALAARLTAAFTCCLFFIYLATFQYVVQALNSIGFAMLLSCSNCMGFTGLGSAGGL